MRSISVYNCQCPMHHWLNAVVPFHCEQRSCGLLEPWWNDTMVGLQEGRKHTALANFRKRGWLWSQQWHHSEICVHMMSKGWSSKCVWSIHQRTIWVVPPKTTCRIICLSPWQCPSPPQRSFWTTVECIGPYSHIWCTIFPWNEPSRVHVRDLEKNGKWDDWNTETHWGQHKSSSHRIVLQIPVIKHS